MPSETIPGPSEETGITKLRVGDGSLTGFIEGCMLAIRTKSHLPADVEDPPMSQRDVCFLDLARSTCQMR